MYLTICERAIVAGDDRPRATCSPFIKPSFIDPRRLCMHFADIEVESFKVRPLQYTQVHRINALFIPAAEQHSECQKIASAYVLGIDV